MARLFVIMGSGETTPTMVTPHQRILAAVGPSPTARLLDTPYGFQENADDITARTLAYFEHNVGAEVEPLSLRDVDATSPRDLEAVQVGVRGADWLFAGPGSPSFVLRQWGRTDIPALLRERLGRAGATVFASAAAVTVGTHAVPVYEVYKAGIAPHWLDGLDLLGELGWQVVVIPHFDNAEGGTHDTRYCYLGERRLRAMEDELPDGTWILGVDEHTAAVLDLEAGTLEVQGRGGVTVRVAGQHTVFPAPATVPFAELLAAAAGARSVQAAAPAAAPAPDVPDTDGGPTAAAPDAVPRAADGRRGRLRPGPRRRGRDGRRRRAARGRGAHPRLGVDTNVSDELARASRVLRVDDRAARHRRRRGDARPPRRRRPARRDARGPARVGPSRGPLRPRRPHP